MTNNLTFTRLSRLLTPLPKNELYLILSEYEAALRDGIIEAAPEEGKTFEISYLDAQGREITDTRSDEFVLNTEASTSWFNTQQLASRYLIMINTGTLGTTEERLNNHVDDLPTLARIRRDALNSTTKPQVIQRKKRTPRGAQGDNVTAKGLRKVAVTNKIGAAETLPDQIPDNITPSNGLPQTAISTTRLIVDASASALKESTSAPQINAEDRKTIAEINLTDTFLNR